MIETCLVLAKRPVPGRVKTRLIPDLTADEAANVAAAALTDTLDAIDGISVKRRILVLDEPVDELRRHGWSMAAQCGGRLDQRIAHAFTTYGAGPTILVGMDTPQLGAEHLVAVDLVGFDAAMGAAEDGGYWVLGLRDPSRGTAAVEGVPMSTPLTGRAQHARLTALGMRVQTLPTLVDVDTIGDARHVAAAAPDTRFARALRGIREAS